jgi:hypothetical protein
VGRRITRIASGNIYGTGSLAEFLNIATSAGFITFPIALRGSASNTKRREGSL